MLEHEQFLEQILIISPTGVQQESNRSYGVRTRIEAEAMLCLSTTTNECAPQQQPYAIAGVMTACKLQRLSNFDSG